MDAKKERHFIIITEAGLISSILKLYPEYSSEMITITERCLDRDGGVKVYYEVHE